MQSGPTPTSPASPEDASSPRVRVRVPAKINLALKVGPLGADGYHPLGTVFHAVSLFDELEVRAAEQDSLVIKGEGAEALPVNDTNLVVRAAELLRQTYGRPDPVRMVLRKTIPVAGGMAGGSADGAAALLALSMLWDLDTQPEDLHAMAAQLGSDVPFALVGGTAQGAGRGTELVPMIGRGSYHWVLALAHHGLSTPEVFRRYDEMVAAGELEPSTELPPGLLNALTVGDAAEVGAHLVNDLEPAALSLRPELARTMAAGQRAGVLGAVLSGSGPTCAFLAGSEEAAMDVATELAAHPDVRAVRRAKGPVPGARPVNSPRLVET